MDYTQIIKDLRALSNETDWDKTKNVNGEQFSYLIELIIDIIERLE